MKKFYLLLFILLIKQFSLSAQTEISLNAGASMMNFAWMDYNILERNTGWNINASIEHTFKKVKPVIFQVKVYSVANRNSAFDFYRPCMQDCESVDRTILSKWSTSYLSDGGSLNAKIFLIKNKFYISSGLGFASTKNLDYIWIAKEDKSYSDGRVTRNWVDTTVYGTRTNRKNNLYFNFSNGFKIPVNNSLSVNIEFIYQVQILDSYDYVSRKNGAQLIFVMFSSLGINYRLGSLNPKQKKIN